jgi:hypothetical protein
VELAGPANQRLAILSFNRSVVKHDDFIDVVFALDGAVELCDDERARLTGRIDSLDPKAFARGSHVLLRSIDDCRGMTLVVEKRVTMSMLPDSSPHCPRRRFASPSATTTFCRKASFAIAAPPRSIGVAMADEFTV